MKHGRSSEIFFDLIEHPVAKTIDIHISDDIFYEVNGDNAQVIARGIASEQESLWNSLLKLLSPNDELFVYINGRLEPLNRSIAGIISKGDNSFIVRSSLPVISKSFSAGELAVLAENKEVLTAALRLKIFVSYFGRERAPTFVIDPVFIQMMIERSINYESSQILENLRRTIIERETTETTFARLEERLSLIQENKISELNKLENEFSLFNDTVNTKLKSTVEEFEKEIDNLRNAQISLLSLQPTVKLWNIKARNHLIALSLSVFAFVAIILFSAIYMVSIGSTYIPEMTKLSSGNTVIASVLLISPILERFRFTWLHILH